MVHLTWVGIINWYAVWLFTVPYIATERVGEEWLPSCSLTSLHTASQDLFVSIIRICGRHHLELPLTLATDNNIVQLVMASRS